MKTIGVVPAYQNQNLGSALIYALHIQAKEEKYETIIYALFREGNVASKINPYGATFFRKYETYVLTL
jgi:ribosomal protein S18 acetylase RimI-like enzyme